MGSRWNVCRAALVIVAVVSVGCTGESSTEPRERALSAEVPDVLGLELAEACATLREEGFEVKIAGAKGDEDCQIQAAVTNQSPEPGADAEQRTTVILRVSPIKSIP